MRSKFSILGHPLHPALVAIPIGLFVWTFAADILYLATDKNKMWYDISLYSGAGAVVTALVAALPGFGDYLTIGLKSRVTVMATVHMILNLVSVGLFAGAFALQVDNGALSGSNLTLLVVLHAVAVGLLSVSGILGGEMVHRHHLAVIPAETDTPMEREIRERERDREHVGV